MGFSYNSPSNIPGLTSLEHCQTNLFKVVELQGVSWRRYCDNTTEPTQPQDDTILKCYAEIDHRIKNNQFSKKYSRL